MVLRNQFHVIDSAGLCSLAGQYDIPIPTQFLAPIDCLKIPALIILKGLWRSEIHIRQREGGKVWYRQKPNS